MVFSKKTLIIFSFFTSIAYAKDDFDKKFQNLLDGHFKQYQTQEYYSGAELSIYYPKLDAIKNYYVGKTSHDNNSEEISPASLFQIGSITKSFTAAIILQLEEERKLSIEDPLNKWLSEYPKWSSVTIKKLLNMNSGLPNYSDAPLWNAEIYNNPEHQWSNKELIKYVYPAGELSPSLKTTYFYTNTGYLLSDLITRKITKNDFQIEITDRTIKKAKLHNTFYPIPVFEKNVMPRLVQGYNYNQYDNPEFVGKNINNVSLSWAAAAGGIVSNSEDVIKWVKALFISEDILNKTAKEKMQKIISFADGKPITKTDAANSKGFGLGVAQLYDPKIGGFWFYEGMTLGFRALYMYVPCNGVIISAIFNSATNEENDHAGKLLKETYQLILDENPNLRCKL